MATNGKGLCMHQVPVKRTLRTVDLEGFTVLLGCGVVDPWKPSLRVVGIGQREGDRLPVIEMVLRPTSHEVHEVGTFRADQNLPFPEDLKPLYDLGWDECPTLLLSPIHLSRDRVEAAYAVLLGSLGNGYNLLEEVRLNPTDPIKRFHRILQGLQPSTPDRSLNAEEAGELASLLLDPVANDRELVAFLGAWDGSLRHAGKLFLPWKVMGIRRFSGILSSLLPSCRTRQH